MKSSLIALFVFLPFVLLPTPLFAGSPDNRVAIADLKSVNIIIDPEDLLPGIALVQNGYVSIVAYQARGYALLPMD